MARVVEQMKRMLEQILRRVGLEIRRLPATSGQISRTDPAERAAIDAVLRRFAASQPADSGLADVGEWRDYLSDSRLALFRDVLRICRDAGLDFDDKRVADVGSGTGYLLRLIAAEAPSARLTGYDTFAGGMPLAEAMCPGAVFEARGLDEIEERFDIVFCTEVLEHLVAPEQALERLAALARPEGAIVLTVPDGRRDQLEAGEQREDGTAYWGHLHFWSPESWPLFLDRSLPSARRLCGQASTGENYAVVWP